MEMLLIFIFASILGGASCIGFCLDKLRKSLASDSSKVQSLLAEIRDKLSDNDRA